MISHDSDFLDRCTDHTLVIKKTGLELTASNFSTWWENNEKKLSGEKAKNEQLKREMSDIKTAMKKNSEWASKAEKNKNRANAPSKVAENHWTRAYEASKSAKLMSLAGNLQRRNERKLEERSNLLKDVEREEKLKITGSTHHNKTPVKFDNVTLKRDGIDVVSGVSFVIERGDKVSVIGENGCGKSTLIKLMAGIGQSEGISFEGDVYMAPGLKLSYVGQDTSELAGTIYDIAVERGVDKTQLSTILIKMGFTKQMLEKDVCELSLGQKKIVML